ncbi:MAG: hypothetical protein J1F22_05505 [Lachnospiraceae bacterium]|nr:hypothetical protein [Lachnospiraceae bacterium]
MMKKRVIGLFLFLTFTLVVSGTGCEQEKANPSPSAVATPKNNMKTLTIYSINSDTMDLIPVRVKEDQQKLSEKYITSLVLENLEEKDIIIHKIKKQGKSVIVSFSSKGKPVKNCSEEMENLILECFANSLLDNLKDCHKVIFRCDGRGYKSEHQSFEINEVYTSK